MYTCIVETPIHQLPRAYNLEGHGTHKCSAKTISRLNYPHLLIAISAAQISRAHKNNHHPPVVLLHPTSCNSNETINPTQMLQYLLYNTYVYDGPTWNENWFHSGIAQATHLCMALMVLLMHHQKAFNTTTAEPQWFMLTHSANYLSIWLWMEVNLWNGYNRRFVYENMQFCCVGAAGTSCT